MYQELQHHGIKGMKWGVRRFQNKDGSLTAAGKKRKNNDSDNKSDDAPKIRTRSEKAKRIAIGAAIVGGTILAVYGGQKARDFVKSTNMDYRYKRGSEAAKKFQDKMNKAEAKLYKDFMNDGGEKEFVKYGKFHNAAMTRGDDKYMEIFNKEFKKHETDSFSTAAKNTYRYYKDRRKGR